MPPEETKTHPPPVAEKPRKKKQSKSACLVSSAVCFEIKAQVFQFLTTRVQDSGLLFISAMSVYTFSSTRERNNWHR